MGVSGESGSRYQLGFADAPPEDDEQHGTQDGAGDVLAHAQFLWRCSKMLERFAPTKRMTKVVCTLSLIMRSPHLRQDIPVNTGFAFSFLTASFPATITPDHTSPSSPGTSSAEVGRSPIARAASDGRHPVPLSRLDGDGTGRPSNRKPDQPAECAGLLQRMQAVGNL